MGRPFTPSSSKLWFHRCAGKLFKLATTPAMLIAEVGVLHTLALKLSGSGMFVYELQMKQVVFLRATL